MKKSRFDQPRVAGLLVLAAGTLLGELSGVVLDDEAIEHGLHDSCSSAGELATASK